GDVMVATRVMCVTGGPELLPDNRLMEAASWAPTQQAAHRGALISAPVVLTSKDEKQRLHASSDADAVDMESYAAACAAVDGGVPWLCVRAITDRCDENLPIDFNRLGPAASSPSAVGRFAAVRPRSWPGLVLLGRNSSRAARSLAVAIHALLIHLQAAE
ncbi:MAG: hypothetical protein KGK12_09395, partial [Armatimonadetes bacterium]|nr:hypothetical protein [Armatimonadota bacterium]